MGHRRDADAGRALGDRRVEDELGAAGPVDAVCAASGATCTGEISSCSGQLASYGATGANKVAVGCADVPPASGGVAGNFYAIGCCCAPK